MYYTKHFEVQELVPEAIYDLRGPQAIELIDERVLITLDKLREVFGSCTVNDWIFKGDFTQSGLRTSDAPEYSPTSQHSFGRAMDCKFKENSAQEVRLRVIENKSLFPYITFIEDDVSWFHFDVRNCERITLWSPTTGLSKIV